MANLIDKKVATAQRRVELVKIILAELEKSNSTFKSSRKLSEYIAEKMTEQGELINSSTLRRANSHYKDLIDNYVGKKTSNDNAASELSKDLKIRQQKQKLIELQTQIVEMSNEVKDRESEVQMLLVDIQEQRNQVMSSFAPPKASSYNKGELVELRAEHEKTVKQLKKAIVVINKLISDADGTYEIQNDSLVDLVSEQTVFTREHLPAYFRQSDG